MRIALASSNGDIVDLHLGKAVSLVIYDVVDNDFDFVETRKLAIDKDAKHQGGDVIQECNDCDVIISTKYGFKSKINVGGEICLAIWRGIRYNLGQRKNTFQPNKELCKWKF